MVKINGMDNQNIDFYPGTLQIPLKVPFLYEVRNVANSSSAIIPQRHRQELIATVIV
jgi:hypothetical protein